MAAIQETSSVDADGREAEPAPKWSLIGPGLLVAATGVGAADLVATMVAGARYGYTLLWVGVLGCILKIILVEGAGRFSLATGRTIFEGWRSLGVWTSIYFVPYIMIWGFVYGASAMSSTALPLAALFPSIPLSVFAVASGLLGLVMVWFGQFEFFERISAVLVGMMFVTVVGAAAITVPNLGQIFTGLIPIIPSGSVLTILSVAGGVGGTITLAAYGYWLREKGWSTPRWMRVMRLDNQMAYIMTGIFVTATLIIGAELLHSANIAIAKGDRGLLTLSKVLSERYGIVFGKVFLVGFWAAAFSSLIGVWNGVSLMFADFVGNIRGLPAGDPATRTGGRYFKAYVVWLTVPPMLLLLLGQPIALILAYGILGALFMPFLAITLLWLLNSERTPARWRNRWFDNLGLIACTTFFIILALYQLFETVRG